MFQEVIKSCRISPYGQCQCLIKDSGEFLTLVFLPLLPQRSPLNDPSLFFSHFYHVCGLMLADSHVCITLFDNFHSVITPLGLHSSLVSPFWWGLQNILLTSISDITQHYVKYSIFYRTLNLLFTFIIDFLIGGNLYY